MYKQIAENKKNTILLILAFVALITLIGGVFAYVYKDWYLVIYVLTISTVYAVFQYIAANAVLVAMTGAKEADKKQYRKLYDAVETLALTEGLPMPKVYVIEDSAPNAFASGRDPKHAIVAATTGLLDIMNEEELRAVMAHEMSHVKNYDIRLSMIVFGLVAIIGMICDMGVRMVFWGSGGSDDEDRSPLGLIIVLIVSILAPLVAMVTQFAVSRQREYLADASAAKMTRYPEGMIAALKKLQEHGRPMRRQNSAAASMYINNPMKKSFFSKLFSTHPPIEERIKKLEDAKTRF